MLKIDCKSAMGGIIAGTRRIDICIAWRDACDLFQLVKRSSMNRWNIPIWLENEITERDRSCIYCRTPFGFGTGKGSFASWEHIVNDAKIVTRENIALCCRSCNSSKGAKLIAKWLDSSYCKRRRITSETIADIAKSALENAKNS